MQNAGTIIQNNVISSVAGSNSIGIYAYLSYARQNVISRAATGIIYGKYQDNLTDGCTIPFSSGTDAGGNN